MGGTPANNNAGIVSKPPPPTSTSTKLASKATQKSTKIMPSEMSSMPKTAPFINKNKESWDILSYSSVFYRTQAYELYVSQCNRRKTTKTFTIK